MGYILPEILENIFNQINDESTLFNLMIVNQDWRDVIEFLPRWKKSIKEDYYFKMFKDLTPRQIYIISRIRNHFYYYNYIWTDGEVCSLHPKSGFCCHLITNFFSTGERFSLTVDQDAILEHKNDECCDSKILERRFLGYIKSWNTIIDI